MPSLRSYVVVNLLIGLVSGATCFLGVACFAVLHELANADERDILAVRRRHPDMEIERYSRKPTGPCVVQRLMDGPKLECTHCTGPGVPNVAECCSVCRAFLDSDEWRDMVDAESRVFKYNFGLLGALIVVAIGVLSLGFIRMPAPTIERVELAVPVVPLAEGVETFTQERFLGGRVYIEVGTSAARRYYDVDAFSKWRSESELDPVTRAPLSTMDVRTVRFAPSLDGDPRGAAPSAPALSDSEEAELLV